MTADTMPPTQMGSPALPSLFRRKSVERSGVASPAQLHRASSGGYAIKKVSSTGDMNDERTAAVGMERRWHKRRDKSRIENRLDLSEEDEDAETDARGSNASGTADTVTSLTSMESTERTHGSKEVVLLKPNRKSRVISSAQKQKSAKEKIPWPPQPIPRSSKWTQSLHAMAANAAADQIAQSSRQKDYLNVTRFASSDQIIPHVMPFSKQQSNRTEGPRKDRDRQQKNKKRPSLLTRLDESRMSSDDNVRTSLPKPQLKRIHTAPSSMQSHRSSVVDDALMNRALSIREDLRQFEMQELAAEAEKAAESGMERFVGSASKFTMEDTPPRNGEIGDKYNDDFVLSYRLETPQTRKSNCLRPRYAMEYTPSYFSRKKIRVTALREFSEVVPSFIEMHDNIRIHLGQKGVDRKILPDEEQHRLFRKNTSQGFNDDDLNSQANASQAGSIVSFSSFAVASLRGIVDYYGSNRSNSLNDHTNATAKSPPSNSKIDERDRSVVSKQTSPGGFDPCCGSFEIEQAAMVGKNMPQASQSGASTSFEKRSTVNSDSDDSSIELYGRRETDGRSSPSSVNGVLLGLGRDDKVLRRRELFPDGTFDEDKSHAPSMLSPSVMSNGTTQSMAKFFSRIQHKFSRSQDDSNKLSKEFDENENFIANYFYTNQDANIVNSEGISNLKLDINPDTRRTEGFCISGCAQNDLLSSCETVGNIVDTIFSWFSAKGDCDQSTHSKLFDPKTHQIVLHHSWIRTWQMESNQRRFFMPPRLAVRHY